MENAFLQVLEQVRQRFEMRVFGYVVMPEHVHLLVSEPSGEMLGPAMQLLKMKVSLTARKLGRWAAGGSPFWLARSFDHGVRNNAAFLTQLRYIHRNPVKRGLCRGLEDWPWSSFRAWALGESGVVEVESEMFAARRKMERRGIRTREAEPRAADGV